MKKRYRKYKKKKNNIVLIILVFVILFKMKNGEIGSVVRYTRVLNSYFNKYAVYFIVGCFGLIGLYIAILYINNSAKKMKRKNKHLKSDISIVDKMKGIEFEMFLQSHFEKIGFNVELTNTTNDYGADLLLKSCSENIVVQAKRYSSPVGIKAIQETCGAVAYFKANRGIVVTNNQFTKNAIQLAEASNIELIDRKKLISLMNKNNLSSVACSIINTTNETKKCPMCKDGLVSIKKGKHGEFYGCNNYPKCTFSRKL